MSNFYGSVYQKIRSGPFVFPIFLGLLYFVYLGWNFWLEDYAANIVSYGQMPSVKFYGEKMVDNVARFIQLAPIFFGYLFLRDTRRREYGLISLSFLGLDWFIGVFYRTGFFSLGLTWTIVTAVEDLVLYTLGSEVLISLSAGLAWEMLPDALKSLVSILEHLANSLKDMFQRGSRPKPQKSKGFVPVGRPTAKFNPFKHEEPPAWSEPQKGF